MFNPLACGHCHRMPFWTSTNAAGSLGSGWQTVGTISDKRSELGILQVASPGALAELTARHRSKRPAGAFPAYARRGADRPDVGWTEGAGLRGRADLTGRDRITLRLTLGENDSACWPRTSDVMNQAKERSVILYGDPRPSTGRGRGNFSRANRMNNTQSTSRLEIRCAYDRTRTGRVGGIRGDRARRA